MVVRHIFRATGLMLATLNYSALAEEYPPSPPPEICANHSDWADDNPVETDREFRAAFREFDWLFTAFSGRFAEAFDPEDRVPDKATLSDLRAEMTDLYRVLAQLIPMRDAGNDAWPLKFLEEEIASGIPLPNFDPPDRQEVLRAAFLRELVSVSLPDSERTRVRFIARLELTRSFLESEDTNGGNESETGALRILATGALSEAYEADFRRPALRVLDHGWHTSLASRLRAQVIYMCKEAAE